MPRIRTIISAQTHPAKRFDEDSYLEELGWDLLSKESAAHHAWELCGVELRDDEVRGWLTVACVRASVEGRAG